MGRWGGRTSPHVAKDGGPGSGPQEGGGTEPYVESVREKRAMARESKRPGESYAQAWNRLHNKPEYERNKRFEENAKK